MKTLFGIRPYKVAKDQAPVDNSEQPNDSGPAKCYSLENIGNYFWVLLFGWWMFLAYAFAAAILLITFVGRHHSNLAFSLAKYYLWPFSKFIVSHGIQNLGETEALYAHKKTKSKENTRQLCPHIVWQFVVWLFLFPVTFLCAILCWLLVVFIPMGKILSRGISEVLLSRDPLNIEVTQGYPGANSNVIFCTFRAANTLYYKYTVFGINVVMLNLFPFVLFSLVFAYLPDLVPILKLPDGVMFTICLLSVIPLSYYIGLALGSLSAQTSFAIGAVLNATFGSMIELILFVSAILSGSLNNLVQASVTGTLLGMMLLLPGLSMVFGGIRHKEMHFNPTVAGVSGVLLLLSIVGAFTPTIFYEIYGHFTFTCLQGCSQVNGTAFQCGQCIWSEGSLDADPSYTDKAKPLMYVCAGLLPVSYIVGLLFTLKTHAHILSDEAGGHGAEEAPVGPVWSKLKCVIILLFCTVMFALISEELVNTLVPTLDTIGVSQTFAGITLFALVPSTAEFVNAIQFALQNNFAMSLEIGNSAAVQLALIQIPVLVFFSAMVSPGDASGAFTLIFPAIDLFAVILAVIIVNYISIDGKANYFLGCSMVMCYLLLIAAFFFVPD